MSADALVAELTAFEAEVARAFTAGKIHGPTHLSGGNEAQLIDIFDQIERADYVFATWRSHLHALLHGIPREQVMAMIMAGKSMNLAFPEHRFFTSAIVGGCLPIALGVAAALKRADSSRNVWCFVGDMASSTGAFHEAHQYASGHDLPITFVVEDNGYSADSPTTDCWGAEIHPADKSYASVIYYRYERTYPHYGVAKSAAGM